ncbi:MAG: hypothetical protein L3J29_03590 [Cyclobacteriaceae bacterium]|nr:hypothetical protein [Cyclobacteriaceae bacterium]
MRTTQSNSKVVWLIIFALFSLSQHVVGKEVLKVNGKTIDKGEVNITPFLYWVSASDTVLFSASRGLINQEHNFVVFIKNTSNNLLSNCIRFGDRYQNVSKIKVLSLLDNSSKPILGYHNSIRLDLQPNETKIVSFFVKELNRDDPQYFSVSLISNRLMEASNESMKARQSFFLGLFAFVCVFNLIMYFVTGWVTYVKYAGFVFFALLYFLYYFGLIQDVFPWVKSISYNLVRIWYSLIFISYFYFVNDFGDYKNHEPRAYKLLNFGIWFKLIESFINTLFHYTGWQFIYSSFYKYTILGFELILMGFIVFYILKNKNIRGRIVIIAASLMIVGGIIDQTLLFKEYGSFYFMEVAVVIELLTFSVGLGYITKLFYQEKRENQQLYIEQLKENVALQKEFTEQLEEKVKLRTIDLQKEKSAVEVKNKENELLLSEVHHRVKNNLQTISSLLSIQQRKLKDPDSIKVLEDSKNRVMAMGLIHQHLYQNMSFSEIDFKNYTQELVRILINSNAHCKIEVNCSIPPLKINLDNGILFGLIINELAINSIKHAYEGVEHPLLEVSIYKHENKVALLVKDNGNTAEIDFNKEDSFGWKMVNTIAGKLEGEIRVDSSEGLSVEILFNKEIIDIK